MSLSDSLADLVNDLDNSDYLDEPDLPEPEALNRIESRPVGVSFHDWKPQSSFSSDALAESVEIRQS